MNSSQDENSSLINSLSEGCLDKFWDRIVEAFSLETQKEMAEALGLTPAAITRWKKGGRPSYEALIAISKLTDHSLKWLLTGEDENSLQPTEASSVQPRALPQVENVSKNTPSLINPPINPEKDSLEQLRRDMQAMHERLTALEQKR